MRIWETGTDKYFEEARGGRIEAGKRRTSKFHFVFLPPILIKKVTIIIIIHPPLFQPRQKLGRRHKGRLRKRDKLLTGYWGRGRARCRIIRSQESLVLYKSIIYLPRILCLSFVLSYSCRPVILSSCHICGTLSYFLCFSNQTDQGNETEGFEREGLEMER